VVTKANALDFARNKDPFADHILTLTLCVAILKRFLKKEEMKRPQDLNSESIERLVDAVTSEVYRRLDKKEKSPLSQELPKTNIISNPPTPSLAPGDLAGMIDHTLLKPDASQEQIKKLCSEAAQYKFATVCVNSSNVGLAAKLLSGTGVKPIAVVGFPLGAMSSTAKAFETLEAIREGAQEIDMVVNLGALKSKDYKEVFEDIKGVVEAAGSIPVKVILETSTISDDEKIIGCALSKAAGAAFVKTSTGFAGGGATVEDIKLMRKIVGPEMGVKASGGIRTYDDAKKMIEAGANRVGASSSIDIVTNAKSSGKGY
jgi:deoxyribose-phosphate aldolase